MSPSTPSTLVARYRAVAEVLGALACESSEYRALTESDLLEINELFGRSQSDLRNGGAPIAGEIAHRSAPELGSAGLAQKTGHRTAEQFIKHTTGATGRDAVTAVRVGSLMREAAIAGEVDVATGEIAVVTQPWLAPITEALASHTLSVEKAESIRAGLGSPNSAITAEMLLTAVRQLLELADKIDPDALFREARNFRDELDLDGVALRAEERRQKRSLRLYLQADGTTKLVWIMDPETAAEVKNVHDRLTSPKLQGPRFVDSVEQALANQILEDDRTTDQLASDGFVQLLKLGADADPNYLLGSGAPIITLTATESAVSTGAGLVRIEGQPAPLPVTELERFVCTGAVGSVVIGADGYVLNFGREQRLFNWQQKRALAITWGGCAIDGCERPPSWTEAHHIKQWKRDGGKTDLKDGILLCKHHHLLSHNLGWEIFRDSAGRYWLSRSGPNGLTITELKKKSLPLRDVQRAAQTPTPPEPALHLRQ